MSKKKVKGKIGDFSDWKIISHLSERAENIRLHPELLDSIEETDPIWHELFTYVNRTGMVVYDEDIPIKEKAKIVRDQLSEDDCDGDCERIQCNGF